MFLLNISQSVTFYHHNAFNCVPMLVSVSDIVLCHSLHCSPNSYVMITVSQLCSCHDTLGITIVTSSFAEPMSSVNDNDMMI